MSVVYNQIANRSLGHREAVLPPVTARRIRWGSGLGSAIVLVAAGVDVQAIATVGYPSDAGAASVVLSALVGMSVVLTLAAVALGVRAAGIGRGATTVAGDEPDIVDDALALAVALVGTLGVGRSPVKRAVDAVESFLDRSPLSPRRHRWMFGVVAAVVIAVAFVLWHALREGPWINASAALIVGTLFGAGVLAVYLGTVGPLRLLRPPR